MNNLTVKRPANGMSPMKLWDLIGKKLIENFTRTTNRDLNMKKFKNIIVSPSCKISKAVEILQTTDEKIILIFEKNFGNSDNGDIRRAIINNINFKLPVTKIINKKTLMMKSRQDEIF